MLNYTSNGNSQCESASNTLSAAFIIQVVPFEASSQEGAWACRAVHRVVEVHLHIFGWRIYPHAESQQREGYSAVALVILFL